ncbi:NAD/NADP transhydrogenase alpha subunit [Rubidibacter lacunae KORDI 51-2]|uniref:NAD(P) transhydrogenase subunit alpha part 1 n=1 Tax=Rubidibacter lacunae KORDI 51-2 TaxID=582515 RepID=U5DRR6_9CHRO|nr:Re/Si-specific NAD(P)(+) transhydrogenase subunit alpha [Rubidibacter lacunae]ERN42385.1 NAD/NADP transhydrogenase alpha subunit [Rubidibacter lacunae KORDI 51-2]
MKLAVAKEVAFGERRVALTPDVVARLIQQGFEVAVESGAGTAAMFADSAYEAAGANVSADKAAVWGESNIVLKVAPPENDEVYLLSEGQTLVGLLDPLGKPELMQALTERGVTLCALEMIPRISRAQSMDALSSQAGVAGYQAVLLAAAALPKFFPMLTTAAGTIRPAKVFVIGAGVAGLQAIATARRLGAVVEAFDIRPAVKEEVQSLGATFVEVKLEEETATTGGYAREVSENSKQRSQRLIAEHVATADVVITTAQVPGRRAPILVTAEMVQAMQPGAVIVDLASMQGGNCELSEAGKDIQRHGVTIIGPINLPSSVPVHASQMFARNVATLLKHLVADGQLRLDFDDDITDGVVLARAGEVRNQPVKDAISALTAGSPV